MDGTLSNTEMYDLLTSETFGHLGCCADNKPYIVPLAYIFHENVIYGQTTEGKKIEMLRKNPFVCFQVQHHENNQWRSVICWGTFEELELEKLDAAEAIHITERLSTVLKGIQDSVGIAVPFTFSNTAAPLMVNGKKSTLFRILVTEKTGKFYVSGK
jgi:nitroimidazol reductase NimA-like FMN-containing flavoprotein (pyridoxamine 5'-phosphate oxidase superfamily)